MHINAIIYAIFTVKNMNYKMTKAQAKEEIAAKLSHDFGVTNEEATYEQYYKAIALIVRDMMIRGRKEFHDAAKKSDSKKIYYLCMEFLMGRSLKNNLYNLNLTKTFTQALKDFDINIEKLYECEPDAGLGNGGLGRLAACYLDGLATQNYCATGYSIMYEYGIFKQKLVDGWQTELPDFWLPGGEIWLVPREEEAVNIQFEGQVDEIWDNNYHSVSLKNCNTVTAIPHDMYIAGKDGKGISKLRLWSAEAPGLDMDIFNQGDYLRAMERNSMAEVISKVLYPSDNHPEGKSLRLRQQYFLVSASIQDIVNTHLRQYGTVENIPEKIAIHINDTHPTLAIPELMRILLDECGYGWDDAWSIVTKTIAYTNHTVMSEALECWPEELYQRLLPRIYEITKEIDNRFRKFVWDATLNADKVEKTAVISNGIVRMANLCVACCHHINGVSALHSQILKDDVFNDFYCLFPNKFTNVTNGIAHRRWLCQSNPLLTNYITELIGNKFVYNALELKELEAYKDDKNVLDKIGAIKLQNKKDFINYVKKSNGITLDPESIFDVHVKRLHEYKRQELNAFNILAEYLKIKENPNGSYTPHTYIFAAKAAPGYFMAKKIISFICSIAELINNDPDVKDLMKVVYLEDYNVTLAEKLMPTANISEQISLSGTEASGTGNMKLMINGAITIGTMDGANVEIYNNVGKDNILIFGMSTQEVNSLKANGYFPETYYKNNAELKRLIDFINSGISGKSFPEISSTITHHDPYMVLADFADYRKIQNKAEQLWLDKDKWNKISLLNIANAGVFSADRAINEYAADIWNTKPVKIISANRNKKK